MKKFTKFAIRCGLTLCAIAGVSAVLIGVVSSFTSPMIEKANREKEANALTKVFGAEAKEIKDNVPVNEGGISSYYPVVLQDDGQARIYKATGRNGFGEISFLLGLYDQGDHIGLGSMIILTNTESYGQTLEENYIGPYQSESDPLVREILLANVKCGATFGATLIRDLSYECVAHYEGRVL